MENVATKKQGTNILKPIAMIVVVIAVLGFVKWAIATNGSRQNHPGTPANQTQPVR